MVSAWFPAGHGMFHICDTDSGSLPRSALHARSSVLAPLVSPDAAAPTRSLTLGAGSRGPPCGPPLECGHVTTFKGSPVRVAPQGHNSAVRDRAGRPDGLLQR